MTSDDESAARAVLAELEERLATHDLDRMAEFFTDDVVLIGDSEELFDRSSTVDYLGVMADMEPTVRWQWDKLSVVAESADLLAFAAAGTMTFHDPSGAPRGEGEHFRVTCIASHADDGWRLKHFHGCAPRED